MPKDAHKVHLATTVVEFASAMESMLSAVSLTGIVSVYLVTMVTCVQNSALKGHMDISVSLIVRVMKMVHDCVTTGQVRFNFSFTAEEHMSLVTRKPVFGVFDQVRLKPVCSTKEAS